MASNKDFVKQLRLEYEQKVQSDGAFREAIKSMPPLNWETAKSEDATEYVATAFKNLEKIQKEEGVRKLTGTQIGATEGIPYRGAATQAAVGRTSEPLTPAAKQHVGGMPQDPRNRYPSRGAETPEDIQKRIRRDRLQLGKDVKSAESEINKVQAELEGAALTLYDGEDKELQKKKLDKRKEKGLVLKRLQAGVRKFKLSDQYVAGGMDYWEARDKAEEEVNAELAEEEKRVSQFAGSDKDMDLIPIGEAPTREQFERANQRVASRDRGVSPTAQKRPPLSSFRKASITRR